MSFSSGTYSLVAGNPVVTGTSISSTWANNTLDDIATALSTCLLKDGTQTATAKVPFAVGIDVTTEITTTSVTFTAFAGATTSLTIGGTGATSTVSIPGTLDATSSTAASLMTAGGFAAAKSIWTAGDVVVSQGTTSQLKLVNTRYSSAGYTLLKYADNGSTSNCIWDVDPADAASGTPYAAINVRNTEALRLTSVLVSTSLPVSVTNYLDLIETTAPAGGANTARLFAVDNGSGKTVLKVIFATGSAIQLAIEA